MNREIKFRVWYVKGGYFLCTDDDPDYTLNFGDGGSIYIVRDGTPSEDGEYLFSQFTGLRDKDGTSIFEGDVVDVPGWNPSRWLVDYSDENGAFYFRHKIEQPYDTCHPMRYLEKATVIGNIHQHPDLLK